MQKFNFSNTEWNSIMNTISGIRNNFITRGWHCELNVKTNQSVYAYFSKEIEYFSLRVTPIGLQRGKNYFITDDDDKKYLNNIIKNQATTLNISTLRTKNEIYEQELFMSANAKTTKSTTKKTTKSATVKASQKKTAIKVYSNEKSKKSSSTKSIKSAITPAKKITMTNKPTINSKPKNRVSSKPPKMSVKSMTVNKPIFAVTRGFKKVELTPVDSSNIYAIGHDKVKKVLIVQFGQPEPQSEYVYQNASTQLYNKLMRAESKGSTFHKLVRKFPNKYPYKGVKILQRQDGL